MVKTTIYTIGHSSLDIDTFIDILDSFDIDMVVDIRSFPTSKYSPQFNKDALSDSLYDADIEYIHMPELGGFRKVDPKSKKNLGWRNKSFRGYADYMQTQEFKKGINKLIEIAKNNNVVIMCAESVPWRCHRSLVSDALIIRKIIVKDIYRENDSKLHKLTSFAKIKNLTITYPE